MANEFTERMRSVGYLSGGRTKDTKVREYRDSEDGHRIKETTDHRNATVTEHATKDDRVDVHLRPKVMDLTTQVRGIE